MDFVDFPIPSFLLTIASKMQLMLVFPASFDYDGQNLGPAQFSKAIN